MIPMQKKPNQSIKKRFFSATIMKPIICASTVFLADRFILKNLNTKSNIAFSASVGGGVMVASSIGEATKNMFQLFVLLNFYPMNQLLYWCKTYF